MPPTPMSLPSASKAATGAPLEDSEYGLLIFKELQDGSTEPVGHQWKTTIEEVISEISTDDAKAIVVKRNNGRVTEGVRVPLEDLSTSGESPTESPPDAKSPSIDEVRASGEAQTYNLMARQLEESTQRAARLQHRIDEIRDGYRKKIDSLTQKHERETEKLRKELEDLRQDRRDLRSDMTATERVAQMAAPQVPGLLAALTQRIGSSDAEHEQARKEVQRQIESSTSGEDIEG